MRRLAEQCRLGIVFKFQYAFELILTSTSSHHDTADTSINLSFRASQGSTNSSFILLSFPSFVIASLIATIVIFVRNSQP